jgi:hypothetical protein
MEITTDICSRERNFDMTRTALIAAAALMMGGGAGLATELPIFEADGFPMTNHQATLLRPANTVERLPESVFVYGSPHLIAVLTARPSVTARMTEANNPTP